MKTVNIRINFTLAFEKARDALVIIANRVLAIFSKYEICIARRTPIQELLFNLCGRDKKQYQAILKWLAYPLQQAAQRTYHTQPVLFVEGDEGSGKSLFFDRIMREIHQGSHFYLDEPNCRMLKNQFNSWLEDAKFVALEGYDYDMTKYAADTLSHPLLTIRRKAKPILNLRNKMSLVIILPATFASYRVRMNFTRPQICIHPIKSSACPELFDEVAQDIENGGIERFKQFLLTV